MSTGPGLPPLPEPDLHPTHVRALAGGLAAPSPRLHCVVAPRGMGVTTLVARALRSRPRGGPALHWIPVPTSERGLLDSLEEEALAVLGPLRPPDRPDLLPRSGLGPAWVRVLEGSLRTLAGTPRPTGGAPPVLVLDGVELLTGARRRLPGELAESWRRVLADAPRGAAPHLVLTARTRSALEPWLAALRTELGDDVPDEALHLAPDLPDPRAAGWLHLGPSGGTAREAFLHWALLGGHPSSLAGASGAPRADPSSPSADESVVRRVLSPTGDLHARPEIRLEAEVQSPGRYAALLGAAARGGQSWSELAGALGAGAGNRIAPYRARLEEAGLLVSRQPLGAGPRSRRTRYRVRDPLDALWFGFVLPRRSALVRLGPDAFLRQLKGPPLKAHEAAFHAVAARSWLRYHGTERLPAEPRESGAVWGQEGELEIAALLANGQVCHGIVQQPGEAADEVLMDRLEAAADRTRYGIGREGRIPLLFLRTPPAPSLQRRVARTPLARIVGWEDLMGPPPPSSG